MRSPDGTVRPGFESELLDLSEIPLVQLPQLDPVGLGRSIRHAVDRTAYQSVTASGSQGGMDRVS
ncbi:hypothetical protein GCM10017567_43780 [Amycolatopsis bullii]|uniref:FXSXX-COOH protein n=1 Tax=Amycolatopsis bullii TaxID=941987 RepID=A0ABQ3KGE2_9PSEU|nr:hypothetical protein GCM10017567_43780 [Amycolatopsis bullii]